MLHFQLCSACYTALLMKNSRSASATIQSPQKYDDSRAPNYQTTINYCLESAVAIMLRFQLCSALFKALQMKNSVVRIVPAINPVTTENTDDSCLQTYCKEAMHCAIANRHLGLSTKRNGTHVVCQKAHLGTKRRRTVKTSSP